VNRIRPLGWVLLFIVLSGAANAQDKADREKDHEALRAILVKGAEALNTRNLDIVAPLLDPGFTIITVDNRKEVGLDAFKKYYAGLFDGPNAMFNKIEVHPVADELTRFLDENSGVVYGTSDDTFHFKDGDVRSMKTRWSATVQREGDGWKLVDVHFSANVLDNPLLAAAKAFATKLAIGGLIVGLVLGALLTLLMRRKRG
jgi:ketosteroid isomerase-like protein